MMIKGSPRKTLFYIAGAALMLNICGDAFADKVYLKNGRSLTGIIKNEDAQSVEIEVCSGGRVKLDKGSVEKIEKGAEIDALKLRNQWEMQKQEYSRQAEQQKKQEEKKPREVEFSEDGNAVLVRVTINRKVEASLILDTGASFVMLRRKVAEELGYNLRNAVPDGMVTVADGRTVAAKHIVLSSVRLQDMEAKNVDAVVLLDEKLQDNIKDGLLGMSFLGRFIFKIDRTEKKLILEKI